MKRKRDYPASRVTKSMKKPATPGVQGFDLKRGLAELEPRSSKNESPILISSRSSKSPTTTRTKTKPEVFIEARVNLPNVHQSITCLLFLATFIDYAGTGRYRSDWDYSWQISDFDHATELIPFSSFFAPRALCGYLPAQEQQIQEWYDLGQLSGLRDKHRDFVHLCGKILDKAYQLHKSGDSSAMDYLLEHDVPRKMWEVGWQKFLDHLDATGQHEKMEAYLQEAYNEVYSLRNEIPILEDHWQECLQGLDKYSQKLRQPRRSWMRGLLSATGDPGGGHHGTVDFAKHWHKPLSAMAQTVLRGWSILGRLVRATVYVSLGCVFCQVDKF